MNVEKFIKATKELLDAGSSTMGAAVQMSSVADPEGDRELIDHLAGGRVGLCTCARCKTKREVSTPFGSMGFDTAQDAEIAKAFNDARRRKS